MIVSLNEIETTILKAARGAGMEWASQQSGKKQQGSDVDILK